MPILDKNGDYWSIPIVDADDRFNTIPYQQYKIHCANGNSPPGQPKRLHCANGISQGSQKDNIVQMAIHPQDSQKDVK